MNWRFVSGLLILGCSVRATANAPSYLELTGLAAFGGNSIACVAIEPGGPRLVLHQGETVEDITLVALDVKGCWAQVKQGTNVIQLRLAQNRPAVAEASNTASRRSIVSSRARQKRQPTADASPDDSNAAVAPSNNGAPRENGGFAQNEHASNRWEPDRNASGTSGSHSEPSAQNQRQFETDNAPGMDQPPGVQQDVSSSSEQNNGNASSPETGDSADPLKLEEDRARMSGIQAFLAWDIAHRDRQQ